MSVSRALPVTRICFNCQHRILSVFASFAGLSLRPPTSTRAPSKHASPSIRHFNTQARKDNEVQWRPPVQELPASESQSAEPSEVPAPSPSESQTQSSLPWYLQVQEQESTRPITQRQELPEIPEDAPEQLQGILEHLSVDIGLDNLSFLDLRKLDPPPALGSNLMMVIGTARGEKHLHVSADRFCRWLRTSHKLRPYADGLLGRGELKLKMRRKARRAKLLGSTSKKADEDDGIRSDWICVNVGSIGESTTREDVLEEEDGFIGFGGREDGTRLVVQMMTEDKRADLDLESLWQGFVRRQNRKEARIAASAEELAAEAREEEVGQGIAHNPTSIADARPLLHSNNNTSSSGPLTQIRTFHSASVRHNVNTMSHPALAATGADDGNSAPPSTSTLQLVRELERQSILHSKLEYLQVLSKEQAQTALGRNAQDRDSTPFLEEFYSHLPLFPNSVDWAARLSLVHIALEVGHPRYSVDDLIKVLHEAQESGSELLPSYFELVIKDIARFGAVGSPNEYSDSIQLLYKIVPILDDMSWLNLNPFTPTIVDILVTTFETARTHELNLSDPVLRNDASANLATILHQARVPIPSMSLPIMALDDLGTAGDWKGFWRYWRRLPVYMLRRPQILYTAMFIQIVRTEHQKMCVDALTEWIPYLTLERPEVSLAADLALAVMDCLRIADPDVERQAQSGECENMQWVRLWRRCEAGLAEEPEDMEAMQGEARRMYGYLLQPERQ